MSSRPEGVDQVAGDERLFAAAPGGQVAGGGVEPDAQPRRRPGVEALPPERADHPGKNVAAAAGGHAGIAAQVHLRPPPGGADQCGTAFQDNHRAGGVG